MTHTIDFVVDAAAKAKASRGTALARPECKVYAVFAVLCAAATVALLVIFGNPVALMEAFFATVTSYDVAYEGPVVVSFELAGVVFCGLFVAAIVVKGHDSERLRSREQLRLEGTWLVYVFHDEQATALPKGSLTCLACDLALCEARYDERQRMLYVKGPWHRWSARDPARDGFPPVTDMPERKMTVFLWPYFVPDLVGAVRERVGRWG